MPKRKRPFSPCDSFDEEYDEEETSSNNSRSGNPPIQRNAANARERARMRVLSSAFCRLKTKLPNIPADTKLSKLDTLRLATIYIQQLKAIVDGEPVSAGTIMYSQTQNLTWPYTFQQITNNYRQPPVPNYSMHDDWNQQSHQQMYNQNLSSSFSVYDGNNYN